MQDALTEDELIISVQTKDGVVPFMLNDETVDYVDSNSVCESIYVVDGINSENVTGPVSSVQVINYVLRFTSPPTSDVNSFIRCRTSRMKLEILIS